jgi:nitrous oxidase accessory protein
MMKRLALVAAAAALLALIGSGVAGAQAPSSLTDLQALIDATPTGGELVLPAGTYSGGVEIKRPLTLRGEDGAVVDAGGEATVITVEAPDVTLTNLVIRNSGDSLDREHSGVEANAPRVTITNNVFENVLFGVFLRGAEGSLISNNEIGAMAKDPARRGDGIRLWESSHTVVEGNTVAHGRDVVLWFSDDLVVQNNVVTLGRYGLHFMYSDRALVRRNELSKNSVGAFLMYSKDLQFMDNLIAENNGPSGYGIGLKDMDGVTAEGNRFIDNRIGLYLDNSPGDVNVYQEFRHNLFAYNGVGIMFLPAVKRNRFSENAFIDNAEQIGIAGTGRFGGNDWSIEGVGNYWSDFAGYDADGDGIGDRPYRLEDLYSTMTDDHPELQFFTQTPAAQAIDAAALLFPTLRPEPKLEDTAPLVRAPHFSTFGDAELPTGLTLGLASALLLAAAAVLTTAALRSPRTKGPAR